MDKTVVLQICLTLFVFYGLGNVVYTELSRKGLYSMLKPTRPHGKDNETNVPTAVKPKWPVIRLNIQKTPRQKKCFKYFTATDGGWIESCIPERNVPEE